MNNSSKRSGLFLDNVVNAVAWIADDLINERTHEKLFICLMLQASFVELYGLLTTSSVWSHVSVEDYKLKRSGIKKFLYPYIVLVRNINLTVIQLVWTDEVCFAELHWIWNNRDQLVVRSHGFEVPVHAKLLCLTLSFLDKDVCVIILALTWMFSMELTLIFANRTWPNWTETMLYFILMKEHKIRFQIYNIMYSLLFQLLKK